MGKETFKPAAVFAPSVFIQEELEERGWSLETLADKSLLKRSLIEELINDKRKVTPLIARCLGSAFGTSHEIWLNLQQQWDEA